MKKFQLDLNLDDEQEAKEFLEEHWQIGGASPKKTAQKLGISGKGSFKLVNALVNYAWNKNKAIACRLEGKISLAIPYEISCDLIYKRNIQPLCECW